MTFPFGEAAASRHNFTPATAWPPRYGGEVDRPRMHWLRHPALDTVELPLAGDLAALVGVRRH